MIVTDCAFRRDRSFVSTTTHEPEILTEAVRWAVLERLVRAGWTQEDEATAMRSLRKFVSLGLEGDGGGLGPGLSEVTNPEGAAS